MVHEIDSEEIYEAMVPVESVRQFDAWHDIFILALTTGGGCGAISRTLDYPCSEEGTSITMVQRKLWQDLLTVRIEYYLKRLCQTHGNQAKT